MDIKVNRIEIIDHTLAGKGREYVKWVDKAFSVTTQLQDNNRTLKIFLKDLDYCLSCGTEFKNSKEDDCDCYNGCSDPSYHGTEPCDLSC